MAEDSPSAQAAQPVVPEAASEAEEARVGAGDLTRSLLHHLLALALFAVALYFTLWFLATNAQLWGVFGALGKPFAGGEASMHWAALGWALGAVAVLAIIGWFVLGSLELYLPRSAMGALALALGMGAAGYLLELLAMAGMLTRPLVFTAMALLIVFLWPWTVLAGRRRPETGEGGEGGGVEQSMRVKLAREWYRRSLIRPTRIHQKAFAWAAAGLIGLISFLIFYHALLYPETYWDSLILYLGYARMMFHEQGIVEKVVGQVGIGLGANYPHLYALIGAAASLALGEWSELPQRLLAPLCGLATTVLVYQIVLRMTRHVNFSLAMTLLYRSIPMGIAWDQYASDYAVAVLFAAAFLYVALLYIETALSGYFILATLLIAFAMHVNYLMGILWLPWGGMLIAAHAGFPTVEQLASEEARRALVEAEQSPAHLHGWERGGTPEPAWTQHRRRASLWAFASSRAFLATMALAAVVASTWHIRNWIVTENPVYAFFYETLGGKNINPAVMESAAKEWSSNGAGIGRMGESVGERIARSWIFFTGGAERTEEGYRVVWPQAYRLSPFFAGFAVSGALVLIARFLAAPLLARRGAGRSLRFAEPGLRFGSVTLGLAAALFAFHYTLAPFYLYQIIIVLPALAVLASFSFPYWRRGAWRGLFGLLVLIVGVTPGVTMGLMGFKVFGGVEIGPGRVETPIDLLAFRHPLPDPRRFYEWQYGLDAQMWRYVNLNLKGRKLLTHENRHLVFDPSIELIHLDDWVIQSLWDETPERQVEDLKRLDVYYYLRVPNEAAHPINARLGTERWLTLGLMELEFAAGGNVLYRIQ